MVRISNMSECTNGETSETACGFVVEFADIITNQPFNSTNTNIGGWKDSEMRTYINGTIYNALPSDLQNVITTTKSNIRTWKNIRRRKTLKLKINYIC